MKLLSSAGRANRTEFVAVTLALVAAELALVWGLHPLMRFAIVQAWAPGLYLGSLLLTGWALLNVLIRRVHDLGESAGLLAVAPVVMIGLALLGKAPWIGYKAGWLALALLALSYLFLALRKGVEGRTLYDPRPKRPRTKRLSAAEAAAAVLRLRERMRQMSLPTLQLRATRDDVFSKLGGAPGLPAGVEWPPGRTGPRAFLAQFDLGEIHASGGPDWLPSEGRLYCFLDQVGWGWIDLVSCLFTHDPLGPRTFREELKPTFRERRVAFIPKTSVPSLDWLAGPDVEQLRTKDLDDLADLPDRPFDDGVQHRVGGYPSEIQGGQMALECEFQARGLEVDYDDVPAEVEQGAKDWRLLLQIDSDEKLGMNWGDAGRLYIFIREEDARAGDFTRTVTLSQCY